MIIKFDYNNFLIMDGEKLLSISHHFLLVFTCKNTIMLSVRLGYIRKTKFLLFSFSTLPSTSALRALTDSYALSPTCPPFAFGPISTPDPVRIPEGYPQRGVGNPPLRLRNDITERHLGRHLSGPRLLLDPAKFLVWVIGSVLPPIPYVSRGVSWMLGTKYQGRDVPPVQEIIMRVTASCRFCRCWKGCHCYGEFAVLHIRGDPN